MRAVLCTIEASREESVSQVVATNAMKLSLTDISTIKQGSIVLDIANKANTAFVEKVEGDIIYLSGMSAGFSLAISMTIQITSIFRYAEGEYIIEDPDGTDRKYEGRLSVPNINEGFGSFFDKKQLISNANINLINSDSKMSDIYHSYNLSLGSTVTLYYGEGTAISGYTKFFTGITSERSNFMYDDSVLSFSIKDNRARMLSTKIPTSVFDIGQFANY